MTRKKGFLFGVHNRLKSIRLKVLWSSQRKRFSRIGANSNVSDLPFVFGYQYIVIGDGFTCGNGVRMEAWDNYKGEKFNPIISIGNNVTLTDRCYISSINKVIIGDGTLIGRDVFITDNSHGESTTRMLEIAPSNRPLSSKGPVLIGKNVWIGRGSTILSGVTIGDNVIIGAHSLINKDVPDNCLAVGCPAKYRKIER